MLERRKSQRLTTIEQSGSTGSNPQPRKRTINLVTNLGSMAVTDPKHSDARVNSMGSQVEGAQEELHENSIKRRETEEFANS